jgi:hypothetical protein
MAKLKLKFVSCDYIKHNSTIQDNVDDNIITPFIYKVQDIYLQQVLGTDFYEHLKNAVSGNTLTANEENLIRDYIQPMIVEYVVFEILPHINYKLTNKAVSQQNSEFSTPSTLDEIKFLRSAVKDMAEFFTARLTTYLCDYETLFPIYANPNNTKENLPAKSKPYFTGIYIPRNNGNDYGLTSYDDPTEYNKY